MAHYLYLGSTSDALKIDESTNIDSLKEDLHQAASRGEPFGLNAYVSSSDEPVWVTVNLAVIPWWAIGVEDHSVQVF